MVKESQPIMPANPRNWNTYLLEKIEEVTDEQIKDFSKRDCARKIKTF